MKHVLTYTTSPERLPKAGELFPRHMDRAREFHERGELLMIGTFADVATDGAMAIFASREGAEEFVSGDPFVLEGVAASWDLREWDEVLAP